MPIYNKNSAITEVATGVKWIESFKGTLITEEGGDSDKALKASKTPVPFPISYGHTGRYEGTSFASGFYASAGEGTAADQLGNASLGGARLAGITAINTLFEDFQASEITAGGDDVVIWSGEGKVELTASAGGTDTKKVIVDVQDLHLPIQIDRDAIQVDGGALVFASVGVTAGDYFPTATSVSSILAEGAAALNENDVINGGRGVALLKTGTGTTAFESTVRLDELSYPFTLAADETLEPLGGAIIFAQIV